jgi:hypothetical protein
MAGDPGPSTWDAAIKDAELIVRALNIGVEGFNRWSFIPERVSFRVAAAVFSGSSFMR